MSADPPPFLVQGVATFVLPNAKDRAWVWLEHAEIPVDLQHLDHLCPCTAPRLELPENPQDDIIAHNLRVVRLLRIRFNLTRIFWVGQCDGCETVYWAERRRPKL